MCLCVVDDLSDLQRGGKEKKARRQDSQSFPSLLHVVSPIRRLIPPPAFLRSFAVRHWICEQRENRKKNKKGIVSRRSKHNSGARPSPCSRLNATATATHTHIHKTKQNKKREAAVHDMSVALSTSVSLAAAVAATSFFLRFTIAFIGFPFLSERICAALSR